MFDHTPYDIFCVVAMAFFGLIGSISNLMIIGAILAEKQLKVLRNVFIVNLAVFDFFITAITFPVIAGSHVVDGGLLSPIGCLVVGGITVWCTVGSIWNIAFISLERYIFVCHNSLYKRYFSKWIILMAMVFLWTICVTAILPGFEVGFDVIIIYEPNYKVCMCNVNSISMPFLVNIVILTFVTPIMICFVSYFNIFRSVRMSRMRISDSHAANRQNVISNKETVLFQTLFTVFVVYLLLCLPCTLMLINKSAGNSISGEIWQWAVYSCLLNCVVNGFIYGLTNSQFRKGYMKCCQMLCFCKRKAQSMQLDSSTSNT